MSHGTAMDRIYRYQRHFYDITRPLFLPGRDALLDALHPVQGERILEMGCGTARNLIRLAERFEGALFFGVDASQEMLDTAFRKIRQAGFEDRICLKHEFAENMKPEQTFSFDGKFDKIFFSYSLTMMPAWGAALGAAKTALHAQGKLFVVDFGDQHRWPSPLRTAFKGWLSLFHVHYPDGITDEIQRLFPANQITSLLSGYAFLAEPKNAAD